MASRRAQMSRIWSRMASAPPPAPAPAPATEKQATDTQRKTSARRIDSNPTLGRESRGKRTVEGKKEAAKAKSARSETRESQVSRNVEQDQAREWKDNNLQKRSREKHAEMWGKAGGHTRQPSDASKQWAGAVEACRSVQADGHGEADTTTRAGKDRAQSAYPAAVRRAAAPPHRRTARAQRQRLRRRPCAPRGL